MLLRICLLSLVFAVAPSAFAKKAAKVNMKPGNWEIVSTITDGPLKGQSHTIKQCITKKDLVPKFHKMPGKMKCSHNQKAEGDLVKWDMSCKGKDMSMKANGTMTFAGKSMEGTANVTVAMPGGGAMAMKVAGSGKYVGPCPSSKKK